MKASHASSPLLSLVILSLLTALVLVATMFLKLPTATGYIHLGDGIIFSVSLALGGLTGATSGALGSFLADILGGYPAWAPWTLVIKGVAGYIVGRSVTQKPGAVNWSQRSWRLCGLSSAMPWALQSCIHPRPFGERSSATWSRRAQVIIATVLTPVLESAFAHMNRA